MIYSGEWEAKDGRMQPFASRKALKEFVDAGGDVRLVDLTLYGGHGRKWSSELLEGDVVRMIYGPNPSRGVPNKWYASIERKGGKLKVS